MTNTSDGWPRLRPPLKRRVHLKVSHFLLKFGEFMSAGDSEWFKRLQYRAEHEPYDPSSSLPESANVQLEHLLYGDLYAVEDFGKLKYGVDQLFREHQSALPSYESKRWHDWVDRRKDKAGGTASSNVGYLDLSDASALFRRCHVAAFGVEGYISLGLDFTPSEKCRDEFKNLLTKGGEFTTLVTMPNLFESLSALSLFSWVRYTLGFRQESRSTDLQRKIDQFFLRCNREAADLVESNIGSGLAPEKPLPSLEIISTDIPRDELLSHEETSASRNSQEQRLGYQFWTNIGERSPPLNPWRWEWGQLYQTQRSDEYGFRSHQMLVHRPDLVRLEDYRIGDRQPGEEESSFSLALRAYLGNRTDRFGALLAIQGKFLLFRDRLVDLRNLLSPQLGGRSGTGLLLKVLRKGAQVLSSMNAVRFSQRRLWGQVEKKRVKWWLFRSLRGANRSQIDSEEPVDFVEDWGNEIETLKKSNQRRLERIESAYEKLFSIVNARVTFLLQLTVAVLTVALLWLTILMVTSNP